MLAGDEGRGSGGQRELDGGSGDRRGIEGKLDPALVASEALRPLEGDRHIAERAVHGDHHDLVIAVDGPILGASRDSYGVTAATSLDNR
jgi:hypothetical protein